MPWKKAFWVTLRVFWIINVLSHLVNVFFLFHVLCVFPVPHVLPTYSMFFHLGCQDGTICGALRSTWDVMSLMFKILIIQFFLRLTSPFITLLHNAGKLDVYPNKLAIGNNIPWESQKNYDRVAGNIIESPFIPSITCTMQVHKIQICPHNNHHYEIFPVILARHRLR